MTILKQESYYLHVFQKDDENTPSSEDWLVGWDRAIEYLESCAHIWLQQGYKYVNTIVLRDGQISSDDFSMNIEALEHEKEVMEQENRKYGSYEQQVYREWADSRGCHNMGTH